MCHPTGPARPLLAGGSGEEVAIPLPDGAALPALLVRPVGGSGPGVLLAHDIYGRTPFYEDVAARLAAAGYLVLLPDCWFAHPPLPALTREHAIARWPQLDEQVTLRQLGVALDWLRAHPDRRGPRLGTIGFCLGGTLVLDLAAGRDDLATVCFYGFPTRNQFTRANSAPPPLNLADAVRGPILGLWGDHDWQVGIENVETFRAALAERGAAFDCVIYPEAGHGFLAALTGPGGAPGDAAAAADGWARTLAFYAAQLAA